MLPFRMLSVWTILGLPAILSAVLLYRLHHLLHPPPLLELDWTANVQWSGKPQVSTDIRPFKISVDDSVMPTIRTRIQSWQRQPQLKFTSNDQAVKYGVEDGLLNDLVDHWQNTYNWTSAVASLNCYLPCDEGYQPHYKTVINGLDIHYVHLRSKRPGSVPLMLVHGWPGSVEEFRGAAAVLMKEANVDLIIPSLPGYGYSQPAEIPGLGPVEAGAIFIKLMDRLGYRQFLTQGGDWGSAVVSHMAVLAPERVRGVHLNMFMPVPDVSTLHTLLTLSSTDWAQVGSPEMLMRETGYMHLQMTKPNSVGHALSDSPVGLAAYILEKIQVWCEVTNPDSRRPPLSFDTILNDVMIYWTTNTITPSIRFYKEAYESRIFWSHMLHPLPENVPIALADFHDSVFQFPISLVKSRYPNLIQTNAFDHGGHFAAWEQPELFARDVASFVARFNRDTLELKK